MSMAVQLASMATALLQHRHPRLQPRIVHPQKEMVVYDPEVMNFWHIAMNLSNQLKVADIQQKIPRAQKDTWRRPIGTDWTVILWTQSHR